MGLMDNARMPSLRDKHRELTNNELIEKTEEIKKEGKAEKVVKSKKSK